MKTFLVVRLNPSLFTSKETPYFQGEVVKMIVPREIAAPGSMDLGWTEAGALLGAGEKEGLVIQSSQQQLAGKRRET